MLSKKETEKIGELAISVIEGNTQLSPEDCSLARKATVGDLIIHCELSLPQIDHFMNCVKMSEIRNSKTGFHYENDIKESLSRVSSKMIRKIIKEECECEELQMHASDPYQPVKNQQGGLDFEDHGHTEQAGMIRSNLYSIFTKANSVYDMIGENDSLPEWLQEKIAVAESMVGAVHDYLKHEYAESHRPLGR